MFVNINSFPRDYKEQAEAQNEPKDIKLYSGNNCFYAKRFTHEESGEPCCLVFDDEWNEWFYFSCIELTDEQIDFAIILAEKMAGKAYKNGKRDQMQELNSTFKQLFGGIFNQND